MVTPEHEAFARAVVAVARQHNMTGLRLDFRKSFTAMNSAGPYETVTMTWSEGRHGIQNNISLETRGQHSITEKVDG